MRISDLRPIRQSLRCRLMSKCKRREGTAVKGEHKGQRDHAVTGRCQTHEHGWRRGEAAYATRWCSSGALHVLFQKKRSGSPRLGCRRFTISVRSRLIAECVRRALIGPDVESLLLFLSQMAQPLDVLGRDPGILIGIMIEHGTDD